MLHKVNQSSGVKLPSSRNNVICYECMNKGQCHNLQSTDCHKCILGPTVAPVGLLIMELHQIHMNKYTIPEWYGFSCNHCPFKFRGPVLVVKWPLVNTGSLLSPPKYHAFTETEYQQDIHIASVGSRFGETLHLSSIGEAVQRIWTLLPYYTCMQMINQQFYFINYECVFGELLSPPWVLKFNAFICAMLSRDSE